MDIVFVVMFTLTHPRKKSQCILVFGAFVEVENRKGIPIVYARRPQTGVLGCKIVLCHGTSAVCTAPVKTFEPFDPNSVAGTVSLRSLPLRWSTVFWQGCFWCSSKAPWQYAISELCFNFNKANKSSDLISQKWLHRWKPVSLSQNGLDVEAPPLIYTQLSHDYRT